MRISHLISKLIILGLVYPEMVSSQSSEIVGNSCLNPVRIGNGNEKYILVSTCMRVGTGVPISHLNLTWMTLVMSAKEILLTDNHITWFMVIDGSKDWKTIYQSTNLSIYQSIMIGSKDIKECSNLNHVSNSVLYNQSSYSSIDYFSSSWLISTQSLVGLLMGRAGPDFDLWMAHPPGSGLDFDWSWPTHGSVNF